MEIDRLINQAVISRVAIAVKNYRAAAVRKSATRRRISRIILASVVNASNRRRRGLGIGRTYEQTEMTESPQEQTTVTPFWFCEQWLFSIIRFPATNARKIVLVTTIGALSSKSVTAGQVIDTARIVCGRVYVTVRTGVRPSVPAIVEWGVKLYSNQPTNQRCGGFVAVSPENYWSIASGLMTSQRKPTT